MNGTSDFIIENDVLIKYRGAASIVEIPEGVARIGDFAFDGCGSITSVTIPDSVTSIGDWAFCACSALASVTVPVSVTSIGDDAFFDCSALASVTIPDSVTSVGDNAFDGCSALTSVTIPDSVTSVGDEAFSGCNSLTEITLSDRIKDAGIDILPDNLRCVKARHLTPPVIEAVKYQIKKRTQAELSVVTGDKPEDIPPDLRLNAARGFIMQPGSYESMERTEAYFKYISSNVRRLISFALKSDEALNFICQNVLIKAEDVDFCLTEAENQDSVESRAVLLEYMNRLGTRKVTEAREKRDEAAEEYAEARFERLCSITEKDGIKGMSFAVSGELEEWKSREALKEYLEVHGAALDSGVSKKTDYLVCNDRSSYTSKVQEATELGVPVIDEAEFNVMIGYRFRDAVHIEIPAWLTRIGDFAFKGCSSLTGITIPGSVTSIGSGAFSYRYSLTSVTIPDSVTSIGHGAFSYCSSLKEITIPESVTYIGPSALYDCNRLTVYTPAGSYAEKYAKENGIACKTI